MKNQELVLYRLKMSDGRTIRVYDNSVHAGVLTDVGDVEMTYEDPMSLLQASGADSYVTLVHGDCMVDAGIQDGNMVVLEANLEPQNGNIVAAMVDDELVLRYFCRDQTQRDVVWLFPANSRKGYSAIRVDATKDFHIVGVVVSAIHSLRRREVGIVSRLRSRMEEERIGRLTEDASCEAGPRFATCVVNVSRMADIMECLHTLIDGRRGKEVAMVVKAAMSLGLITKPTFGQMVEEFGDIGNRSGFHRYMAFDFFDTELQPFRKILQHTTAHEDIVATP